MLTIRFYDCKFSFSIVAVSANGYVAFAVVFVCSVFRFGGDRTPMSDADALTSTVFERRGRSLANGEANRTAIAL